MSWGQHEGGGGKEKILRGGRPQNMLHKHMDVHNETKQILFVKAGKKGDEKIEGRW
jgi:hypothetical protein